LFFGLFMINCVSAFGIGDFFESIGSENLLLMTVFVLSFLIISFSLGRTIGRHSGGKGVANSIAIIVSLMITAGYYFSGWNLWGVLEDLIPYDILIWIIPIALLAGVIYFLYKVKHGFSWLLIIAGIILLLLGIFDVVYARITVGVIGVLLIILGLWLLFKKKRGLVSSNPQNQEDGRNPPAQQGQNIPNRRKGLGLLIVAAKTYKKWAIKQNNPGYFLVWAKFIHYLKQNKYGNSEREIATNLGVTVQDIVNIWKKYGYN